MSSISTRASADLKAVELQPPFSSEAPQSSNTNDRFDVEFHVPFTHRLRFTRDICHQDVGILLDLFEGDAGPSKVLLVCESAIRAVSTAVDELVQNLRGAHRVQLVTDLQEFVGGECIKQNSAAVDKVLDLINRNNLDRRSYIVAVGGGAFLDAIGYAAAIAHRGIRLIRLPTTTLAQADSGVGVKNAINHFGKKNWIGTFAVPWAVINDSRLIETLPDDVFRCGFAETVKVSALKDAQRFQWLQENASLIAARDMDAAIQAIKDSCLMHMRHITHGGDAFEMQEARPLDFGHWSAHRLEAMTNYTLSHGEAVAIGVALDSIYSALALGLPESQAKAICLTLRKLGLSLWHDALDDHQSLLIGLEEFRQHLGGRLTVTMLREIGKPVDVHSINTELMATALNKLKLIAHQTIS
jgi:3-dehydroquinate synthase